MMIALRVKKLVIGPSRPEMRYAGVEWRAVTYISVIQENQDSPWNVPAKLRRRA
jgi:hypothetical protein